MSKVKGQRPKVKVGYVVILASVLALSLALVSQYGFGFHPCELCIWQRWSYGVVIFFAILCVIPVKTGILKIPGNNYILAGMTISIWVVTSIAAYHFGIEQKWWEGLSTCSSGFHANSLEELKAQIMGAPVTRCDEPTWFFLGLSMAGWNVLYSAALGIYALKSLLIRRRAG